MRNILLFLLLLSVLSIASCNHLSSSREKDRKQFDVSNHFEQGDADSLLVDMVTYIGRKPPQATSSTRFDSIFRAYYVNYANEFNHVYHFVNEQGMHYYYITRPARSTEGNRRGVGGLFTMKENKITDFEELFNTPVSDEDHIREIGLILFKELVSKGHVEEYMHNTEYIEWPDARLKYNKEMFEWRYID
jgi:hypothetical protein